MSELQGLQLSLDEFRQRGCRVFGMVVDPVETNAQLARDARLDFSILSDPDLHTTDAYGLRHRDGHEGHDIALSASVLVDAGGIVRWTHVTPNLRVRPLPATILAAVDTLAVQPHSGRQMGMRTPRVEAEFTSAMDFPFLATASGAAFVSNHRLALRRDQLRARGDFGLNCPVVNRTAADSLVR